MLTIHHHSPVELPPTRHFNTSRQLKSVNDSSTIDFAYLPDEFNLPDPETAQSVRVPLLPDAFNTPSPSTETIVHSSGEAVDAPVMKAEIYTVSDPDGTHSHLADGGQPVVSQMQEVVDNHAIPINPFTITETVNNAARKVNGTVETAKVEAEKTANGLKTVWDGFVDDLLGKKPKAI